MTTDPHSPDTPELHADIVDLWASRTLDGDVTPGQIPDALRTEVEQRVTAFSEFRSRLQQSSVPSESSALREAQIAHALRSAMDPRGDRSFARRTSRVVLAAAASIIGVLIASTLVMRQDDSGDVDLFADSISDDSGELDALSQSAPAFESDSGSAKSSPSETDPRVESMATADEENLSPPEYSSVDDIARVASSLPPGGTVIEGLNQSVEVPRCAVGPTPPLRTEGALLDGVPVEIHFREGGGFAVYDISTCSMVASQPSLP